MRDAMMIVGFLAVFAGAGWMLYGLLSPSAPVYSDTINFEMVANRLAHIVAGGSVMIAGAVFAVAGVISPVKP